MGEERLGASCWLWEDLSQAPAPALLGLRVLMPGTRPVLSKEQVSTHACQPSHSTRFRQVTAKIGIFLDRKTVGCVCGGGGLAHHAGQGS